MKRAQQQARKLNRLTATSRRSAIPPSTCFQKVTFLSISHEYYGIMLHNLQHMTYRCFSVTFDVRNTCERHHIELYNGLLL